MFHISTTSSHINKIVFCTYTLYTWISNTQLLTAMKSTVKSKSCHIYYKYNILTKFIFFYNSLLKYYKPRDPKLGVFQAQLKPYLFACSQQLINN